jgi:DNA-binding CsgD family transcriptional regulator
MSHSLKLLFESIYQVETEQELRSQIVPQIGKYFTATRRGIFFFDQLHHLDRKIQTILNLALSVERNPVARYLVDHHAPVHEGLVTSPTAWKLICPRPDHWHVMVGPIVDRNQLVGVVGCTRGKSMPAFEAQDLADLSAVCLHLSVWVATQRSQPQSNSTLKCSKIASLTPREFQIAEQVVLGQTNAEIGNELWITENTVKQALKRVFRKLEVSSRAEMVALIVAAKSVR